MARNIASFLLLLLAGCGGSPQKAEKPLSDQLEEALANKDNAARANRLCTLARKLGEAKDFSSQQRAIKAAVASANLVEEPLIRAGVQIKAAAELARADQPREARDLLDKARETAQKIEEPAGKVRVLTDAARALGEIPNSGGAVTSYCQEALQIADGMTDPFDKVKQYAAIAPSSVKADVANLADDCLAKAREAAGQITDEAKQSIAQAEIGAALAKMERENDAAGAFKAAREKADAIEDPYLRASAQLTLAKLLKAAKRQSEAVETAAAAEKSIQKIKSPSDQATVKEEFDKLQRKL